MRYRVYLTYSKRFTNYVPVSRFRWDPDVRRFHLLQYPVIEPPHRTATRTKFVPALTLACPA